MDFWDRVREELKRLEQKQEWLCYKTATKEKPAISFNTLRGWITKDRFPDAEGAQRLAEVLGVSVEYLVTGRHPAVDAWALEHRELIADLKALTPERLDDLADTVAKLAEKSRRELGKISSSGSTAT